MVSKHLLSSLQPVSHPRENIIYNKKGVKEIFPFPTPSTHPGLSVQLSYFPRPHCLYLTWFNQAYSFKHTYLFIFLLPVVLVPTTALLRLTTLLNNSEFLG
jgi:hypothetical protein